MTSFERAHLAALVRTLEAQLACIKSLKHILPSVSDPSVRTGALIRIRDHAISLRFDCDVLRTAADSFVQAAADAEPAHRAEVPAPTTARPSAISNLQSEISLIPEDSAEVPAPTTARPSAISNLQSEISLIPEDSACS